VWATALSLSTSVSSLSFLGIYLYGEGIWAWFSGVSGFSDIKAGEGAGSGPVWPRVYHDHPVSLVELELCRRRVTILAWMPRQSGRAGKASHLAVSEERLRGFVFECPMSG
jgi:hypothetical protein